MVTNIISQERLTKYLVAAGHNPDRALALYGWNIQLSEAFFPVLSAAEVSLRNIIVARLIALYGPQWWDDPAFLLQIKSGGKRIVKTARDKLVTTGAVTSGRMTAELNFGFWGENAAAKARTRLLGKSAWRIPSPAGACFLCTTIQAL